MPRKPTPKVRPRRLGVGALSLAGILLLGWGAVSLTRDPAVGKTALQYAKEIVTLGPRSPGTEPHREAERYIAGKLAAAGIAVEQDRFTAQTPIGPVAMNNLTGRLPGGSGRTIILATHYDTKWEPNFRFVGANDGGSGTGLLLALAPVLAKRSYQHRLWLVFLDGEEAFQEWSATDSLYGSRRFAAKLKESGSLSQVGAFLLVDMIGDRELDITRDSNSTPWLTDLVWRVARRLGYSRHFLSSTTAISDDHLPLIEAGVPAVDLIDFNYGRGNRYWHSPEDTLDKLSAQSLDVVGDVLLEVIAELDRQ